MEQHGLLILGNQLFATKHLNSVKSYPIYMAEDLGLCTYVRHHQQKIVLFLAAMREYAQELKKSEFDITYQTLVMNKQVTYESRLQQFVENKGIGVLHHFEIEDHFFDRRIERFCTEAGIERVVMASPMFVTSRDVFREYLETSKRPFLATFYKQQRRRLNLLVDSDGKPQGGQWSFDADNRRKLPKSLDPPPVAAPSWTPHTKDVIELVNQHFGDHPGRATDFWWPVTRRSALTWLRHFLEQRIFQFGDYQDAIAQRSETVFHSLLTPMLNVGLITPADVIEKTLALHKHSEVPLNSLEGFIRQVVGWREFMRGIYHNFDDEQQASNFFSHHRSLTQSWYTGETNIPPLDHAIKTADRLGWTHHISRLMVLANLMNLCEVRPREVHDWFMETHVDSSDWVMGPNVYGMGLFSDGGIFATKPYICGSNYLLKMSDFTKGDWCDVVDGLYWRFIDNHQDYFAGNQRLSMMVRMLNKLQADRKERLYKAADDFLATHTTVNN